MAKKKQVSRRAKQLQEVDIAQHNARVQVTLANILQNLGLYLETTKQGDRVYRIHPNSEKGVDIQVRRRKGEAACVDIEVENKKGGGAEEDLEGWLSRTQIRNGDAKALIVVHGDPGWWSDAAAKVQGKLKDPNGANIPVHCVGLEDYQHLVPMLVCRYLLSAQSQRNVAGAVFPKEESHQIRNLDNLPK